MDFLKKEGGRRIRETWLSGGVAREISRYQRLAHQLASARRNRRRSVRRFPRRFHRFPPLSSAVQVPRAGEKEPRSAPVRTVDNGRRLKENSGRFESGRLLRPTGLLVTMRRPGSKSALPAGLALKWACHRIELGNGLQGTPSNPVAFPAAGGYPATGRRAQSVLFLLPLFADLQSARFSNALDENKRPEITIIVSLPTTATRREPGGMTRSAQAYEEIIRVRDGDLFSAYQRDKHT